MPANRIADQSGGLADQADADRVTVTRVIVYRVRLGEDARFQAWQKAINDRALAFPGIAGIDVIPSTVNDFGHEWIVVYRFLNNEAFQAWFDSRARADMIANAPDIFTETQFEYTLKSQHAGDDGQTIVTSNAVIPGKEAEYEAADRALNEAAARFPGFAGAKVFKPSPGHNIWSTMIRFDDKAGMERWLASKERAAGRKAMYQFVVSHHANVLPTGFGSWFAVNAEDSVAAPAWKQAMVVLAALFPVVMILNLTVGNLLTEKNVAFPVNIFIGNTLADPGALSHSQCLHRGLGRRHQ